MREARRVLVASAVAVSALCALVAPSAPSAAGSGPYAVLEEVNRVRAEHGLRLLQRDPRLARAARGHVNDLLRRNVFEHGDVAGRLRGAGARGPLFAENLAWGPGSLGARRIVRLWMESAPHRRILLRPGWRRIGIGIADGTFSGYPGSRVVAADFAGR